MDVKESDILGSNIDQHWYYSSKAQAMRRFLQDTTVAKILDVGAGSGFFSRYLLTHTNATQAWCVDTSYTDDSDELTTGKPMHFRRSIEAINADLVLLMDVLEHVDDDVALLTECVNKVPNHSRFLITVPAFQFLWSGHDDFLEHKRRYTLKQLETVVRKAGLQVKCAAYYFGMVFPIAAALRMLQKSRTQANPAHSQLTPHHPIINQILKSLCRLELSWMRINRAAGLTVFCLAEKA